MIPTVHNPSVARSVLLGPILSETRPAPKAAKMEKISEKAIRLLICASPIPKALFAKIHILGMATNPASMTNSVTTIYVPMPA
jgi:hypothetical protein